MAHRVAVVRGTRDARTPGQEDAGMLGWLWILMFENSKENRRRLLLLLLLLLPENLLCLCWLCNCAGYRLCNGASEDDTCFAVRRPSLFLPAGYLRLAGPAPVGVAKFNSASAVGSHVGRGPQMLATNSRAGLFSGSGLLPPSCMTASSSSYVATPHPKAWPLALAAPWARPQLRHAQFHVGSQ